MYIASTNILTASGQGTVEVFSLMTEAKSLASPCSVPGITDEVPAYRIRYAIEDTPVGMTRLEALVKEALNGVSLDIPGRWGIVLSTTKGNVDADVAQPLSQFAQNIAKFVDVQMNDVWIVSTACISGVTATVMADRLISSGKYDNVVVIGADEVSSFVSSGFESFKTVSRQLCRPFDKDRDGLTLGEAVGIIVLTNNKTYSSGISIYGGAMSNDANHISAPSRTGAPLAWTMNESLRQAQLSIEDIDMLNVHGTATLYNDEMESKAVGLCNAQNIPLNSFKPFLGHTLGACGVVEISLCCEQLRKGLVLGVVTLSELGTPVRVNISKENRSIERSNFLLKVASGFGGSNASLVLGKGDNAHIVCADITTKTLRTISVRNNTIRRDDEIIMTADDTPLLLRNAYNALAIDHPRFLKMDRLCKMGFIASEYLLSEFDHLIAANPTDYCMVLMSYNGCVTSDLKHQKSFEQNGAGSPAIFVYTLPNIVLGEICIRRHIQGETTMLMSADKSHSDISKAEGYAKMIMCTTGCRRAIVGFIEDYECCISLIESVET